MGARLDEQPELLFHLRNVDHAELITAAGTATAVTRTAKPDEVLKSDNLSSLFGIDLDSAELKPAELVKNQDETKISKLSVKAVGRKTNGNKTVIAKLKKTLSKTSQGRRR